MISASLSLSLPRLGWKSTSTPRSLKICTAAGDSASEMRTLGLDIGVILCLLYGRPALKAEMGLGAISSPSPRSYGERVGVRGSHRRGARGESPSPGLLRRAIALPGDPTSPRKNGARLKEARP